MPQEQYYVVERENDNIQALFSWDQSSGHLGLGQAVDAEEPLKFRVGEPLPNNINWMDFHTCPDPVISPSLAATLQQSPLHGSQFFKAKVHHPEQADMEAKDYVFWHIWLELPCLDKENSELDLLDDDEPDGDIFGIDSLALNEELLNDIEEEQRLVFRLKEHSPVILIHEKIKQKIEKSNARGLRFFPVSDWNSDLCFD
ncbi:imm11 family protein [Agaribacterium haliotis]|uniref:imm11 family protein n=1 Tax=Agaribacterium haliotis TaxID=2013869 RepID=UPI000BB52BEA|nr:DUF1629 domain-containing protein [Agaribacterium haliotis]